MGVERDVVARSLPEIARPPEEIVHLAVYLASDETRWTNGASLVVDGGITVNYF